MVASLLGRSRRISATAAAFAGQRRHHSTRVAALCTANCHDPSLADDAILVEAACTCPAECISRFRASGVVERCEGDRGAVVPRWAACNSDLHVAAVSCNLLQYAMGCSYATASDEHLCRRKECVCGTLSLPSVSRLLPDGRAGRSSGFSPGARAATSACRFHRIGHRGFTVCWDDLCPECRLEGQCNLVREYAGEIAQRPVCCR